MKDRPIERSKAPVGKGARFAHLVKQLSSKEPVADAPSMSKSVSKGKFGKSRFAAK